MGGYILQIQRLLYKRDQVLSFEFGNFFRNRVMNNLTKILSTAALGLTVAFGATVSHAAPVPIGTCSVNDVNLGLTSSSTPKANDCENYAGNDSSPLNALIICITQRTKSNTNNGNPIHDKTTLADNPIANI